MPISLTSPSAPISRPGNEARTPHYSLTVSYQIGQVGVGGPRRKGLPALQSVVGNSGTPLGYPDIDLRS